MMLKTSIGARAGLSLAQLIVISLLLAPALTARAQEQSPSGPSGQSGQQVLASSQPAAPATAQTHPNNPELWDSERMMEDAVIQISRRYNLNEAQEEFTRLLLVKRVRAFLDVYEIDVRELLRESIDLRLGLRPTAPDAYLKWATRAAPIYEAAQEAILSGNDEWREILDAEQKKIHDADLAAMRANFQQVGRMLDSWKAGGAPPTLASGPNAGNRPGGVQGGGTPVQQQARVSDPQPPVVHHTMEDSWLAYVNKFIQAYKLDDKQAIAAREKIYKEVRDDAVKYRDKHKKEFAALDAEQSAAEPKMKPADINRRLSELEAPISELFVGLDRRMRDLLDHKQISGVDPTEKEQLEAMYQLLVSHSSSRVRGTGAGVKAQPSSPAAASRPAPAADSTRVGPAKESAPPKQEQPDRPQPTEAEKAKDEADPS